MARSRAAALTFDEMRRLDLNAAELGHPPEALMRRAGDALARHAARRAGPKGAIVFLCGKGGNGGDGFAAAARLQEGGRDARVLLAQPASAIRASAPRHHFGRLAKGTVAQWRKGPPKDWPRPAVIVDCLLGIGQAQRPRAPMDAMIAWADRQRGRARLIACDVPSGLGSSAAFRAHETVTFHAPKAGLAASAKALGTLHVAPIGIPAAASHIGFGDLAAGYVGPRPDSHKGDNGVVLVVAGSIPLLGAAHYVSLGAYRTGADLVHIAAPPEAATALRKWGPAPIVHDAGRGRVLTPAALPVIERRMDRCTALCIGPGLGQDPATLQATRLVLAAAADRGLPTIVDADGLDAVDDALLERHGAKMVLTPHAREFLDLTGTKATRSNIVAYARHHGVTVLAKGPVAVVSDGATTRECHLGHPTLTVGGTGDVLAGTTAALLAKGAPPFDAACAASYLVKAAGEVAASLRSYGASATDVAEAIPAILVRLEAHRQAKA